MNSTVCSGPMPAAATDEDENVNLDANFVSRIHTLEAAACSETVEAQPFCEFDDLLVYLSTPQLMGALVKAGWLP